MTFGTQKISSDELPTELTEILARLQAGQARTEARLDAQAMAFAMVATANDPRATRARMDELQKQEAVVTKGAAKLAADRAAFEEHQAAALAEIEKREKHAGAVWKVAQDAERAMKAREQRCEQREIEIGVTAGRNQRRAGFAGTTLTGDPEREPVRQPAFSESKQDAHVDRHGLPLPDGVTLGQGTPVRIRQ